MSQFLTFNDTHGGGRFSIPGVPDKESEDVCSALREPMPLRSPWVLWEQVCGTTYKMNKVVTFKTAQEFWAVWNAVPQPSELLDGKRLVREGQDGKTELIDAISIFREGISAGWEDPANDKGGKFQINLKPTTVGGPGQLDEYWNNIVLAMVGETMTCSDLITGVRLVDKLSTRQKATDSIRVELWYHSKATKSDVEKMSKSLHLTLATRLDGKEGSAWRGDAIQEKRHK